MDATSKLDRNSGLNIAVIIPAHNEELTIRQVLSDFHAAIPEAQLWVVNNCSTDKTREIAIETLERVGAKGGVLDEFQKGKSNACRKGFNSVDADIYVMVDADATYPAERVHDLIRPILDGRADMTVGDRSGSYHSGKVRPFHGFGNRLVCSLLRLLFSAKILDVMSGYRAFTKEFIRLYPILQSGFELETEMTIHALTYGYRIEEVPVQYSDRPEGSASKLSTFSDGFRVLKLIVRLLKNNRPLYFFGGLSVVSALIGIFMGWTPLSQYWEHSYVEGVASAIFAASCGVMALLLALVGIIMDTIAVFHQFNYELGRNQFRAASVNKSC